MHGVEDPVAATAAAGSGTAIGRSRVPDDRGLGWPAGAAEVCIGPAEPRDEPYEFNGVQWRLHDTGASRTWTSTQLLVNVSIEVPDAYSGQAELLGALAPTLLTLGPAAGP